MAKLKWWLWIVGAFNLALGLMNVVAIFASPRMFTENMPYTGTNVDKAFTDAWMAFALDLVVVGAFLIWAGFRPRNNINVVWLIVWLELFHGVVDDAFLVSRGYSAGQYVVFGLIHVVIVVTGIVFARGAAKERDETPAAVGALR